MDGKKPLLINSNPYYVFDLWQLDIDLNEYVIFIGNVNNENDLKEAIEEVKKVYRLDLSDSKIDERSYRQVTLIEDTKPVISEIDEMIKKGTEQCGKYNVFVKEHYNPCGA